MYGGRETTGERALAERIRHQDFSNPSVAPESRLVHAETVERVRKALRELPAEQAEVVRRRMFREQKFAEIAAELNLPLGTVLTRMRLALARLRKSLKPEE